MHARAAALRQDAARLRAMAERLDAEADSLEWGVEPENDLIRYSDAAPILRTSKDGVRKRVERGQLDKHMIANRPFVSEAAVRALASTASALSASLSAMSACDNDEAER